jgi:hypothetical protein
MIDGATKCVTRDGEIILEEKTDEYWISVHQSPDGKVLAIETALYGDRALILMDFREPARMCQLQYSADKDVFPTHFFSWSTDSQHVTGYTESVQDIRKSDGKFIDDLPRLEWPLDPNEWDLKTTQTMVCMTVVFSS